jgi:ABC-2 type transport system permease protein
MLLCLPLGLLTLNLTTEGVLYLPSVGQAIATLAVSFGGCGVGAAAGVLVSLRSESVRHAQQVLAIGALVTAFLPIGLLQVLPRDWTAEVFQALAYGSPTRVAWLAVVLLFLVGTPILGVAQNRFRRGRILLK